MEQIKSLADLERLEKRIGRCLRPHSLDAVLLSLRAVRPVPDPTSDTRPFVLAMATRFALRYCVPGPFAWSGQLIPRAELNFILHLTNIYALADPVVWDPRASTSTLSIMLRHAGNQFCFNPSIEGKWGRAEILWNNLPRRLKVPLKHHFNFHEEFERAIGATVADFIDVAYVAYSAAVSQNHKGFARDYFEVARQDGMRLADDFVVRNVLASMAATRDEHLQKQRETQQTDPAFAVYDYSSLLVYPLIRPWAISGTDLMAADRLIAPLPEMIPFRLSMGVYYDMHARYRDAFDKYFGHLFEAYVGHVLRASLASGNELFSEADIRAYYPERSGKAPDWIIIDGKTAVLFECKTVRLKREVCVTGSEDKLKQNLTQVRVGLVQTKEFGDAILARSHGLERFYACEEYLCVIVTPEQLYLSASAPFKAILRNGLPDHCVDMRWSLLSIDELEWFQPHLVAGVGTGELFNRMLSQEFNAVIAWAHEQTGRTYADSFLCTVENGLFDRLGVPRPRDDR